MAGYSGKPLVEKLGLKPTHRVVLAGAPAGFARQLEPLPKGLRIPAAGRAPLDCVLLFAPNAGRLIAEFPRWAARLTPSGMLWVAWPKKAAKLPTDLDENVVREIGLGAGLVDVKVCAVDEVWSGLKFVRRLRDR
jgi:hypothetical protein